MTKKKTQTSKGPTNDMSNLLDDLFAEAVEAVEAPEAFEAVAACNIFEGFKASHKYAAKTHFSYVPIWISFKALNIL